VAEKHEASASWGLLTHLVAIGLRPALQSWWYRRTRQRQDARFGRPLAPAVPWQRLAALDSYERDAQGITCHTAQGSLRLDILAEDCLRVRVSPTGALPVEGQDVVAQHGHRCFGLFGGVQEAECGAAVGVHHHAGRPCPHL